MVLLAMLSITENKNDSDYIIFAKRIMLFSVLFL